MFKLKQWHFCYFFLLPIVSCLDIPCSSTDYSQKCLCYKNPNEYEFQCPSRMQEKGIVMHIEVKKKVTLDCYQLETFNVTMLPKLEVGPIKSFSMQTCPEPIKFHLIFDQLGLTQLEYFRFQASDLRSFVLDKTYFKGLEKLQGLSLNSNHLVHLQEDFFEFLPNLTYLDLKNNQIQLKPALFRNLTHLEWLDIVSNNLKEIPEGLFSSLKNLKVLHLWNNNLTKLGRNIFSGLHNLSSLELSVNKIRNLSGDTFSDLVNLKSVSLLSNNLSEVPEDLFKKNKQLELVKIGLNPIRQLPDFLFANLPHLKVLHLNDLYLKTIPENFFEGLTNLQVVKLTNNLLENMSETIFHSLVNVKEIYLSKNLISEIPIMLFSGLDKLEKLYLDNNNLERLQENVFKDLVNLKEIVVSSNKIKTIHNYAFPMYNKLVKIILAHNQFNFEPSFGIYQANPFNGCSNVEILDLSYNKITEIIPEFIVTNNNLKSLDLSHNYISYVMVVSLQPFSRYKIKINLSHNNITIMDFNWSKLIDAAKFDAFHYDGSSSDVYLANNPINCDCRAMSLINYFHDKAEPIIKTIINLQPDNLTCATPAELKNQLVHQVSPKLISCPLTDLFDNYTGCPATCDCFLKPYFKAVVVDCSDKNLTTIPEFVLPNLRGYNHTEVYLDGNYLLKGPEEYALGYDNVTKLVLSRNQIEKLTWFPPKTEVLKLDQNNISRLSSSVLDILTRAKLRNLTLAGNPLICDCLALNLTNFIRKYVQQIDITNVKCAKTDQLLVNLSEAILCHTYAHLYIITLLVIMLFGTSLIVLYCMYQQQIKIWLYSRNLCLWWVSEDELDKDKIYDAFISYSHKDEDFVMENLLPVLEGGSQPYKLCLHYRNWIPGEFIAKQVVNSVKDSRRTVVVLSPNFLESVWSKLEFRTAHTEAMSEGRARVIVILYGNVDMKKLDKELRAYLDTNTYVKWGDPWFWDKLKYALPHSKKLRKNNQKHANMMATIDDKFTLTVPQNNVGTTPPVLTLDVELLKKQSFTPPSAEAALIKSEV